MGDDAVTATLAEWEALAEGATEGPWTPEREGDPAFPDATEFWWVASDTVPLGTRADAEFIAAAREMVPALLAMVEAVRGVHRRAHAVFSWKGGFRYEDPCPECDGAPGTHPCGCWADRQIEYVCAECHRLGAGAQGVCDYTWPCPTAQALTERIGGA